MITLEIEDPKSPTGLHFGAVCELCQATFQNRGHKLVLHLLALKESGWQVSFEPMEDHELFLNLTICPQCFKNRMTRREQRNF